MDNTNVSTVQYVVTSGSTFTHLQARDMTYTVRAVDAGGMECEVTAGAKSGRYQLVTDYIAEPATASVVMHTRLIPLVGSASDYKVYVRFDGTINGNGNGGGGTSNGGGDTATVDAESGAPTASRGTTAAPAPATCGRSSTASAARSSCSSATRRARCSTCGRCTR